MINRPLKRKPVEDDKIYLVNFSSGASTFIEETFPDSSEVAATLSNFSAVLPSADEVAEMYNFTIMEYLNEMQRTPAQTLNLRVKQLTNYVYSRPVDNLMAEKEMLVDYIGDLIEERIYHYVKSVADGKDQIAGNLLMYLGITRWLKNKKLSLFAQRSLDKVAENVRAKGYIDEDGQAQIRECYHSLMNDIIQNIDKTLPIEKQGVLTQAV